MQQFDYFLSPHFFRTIPRIILALLIIASFGLAISRGTSLKDSKVLGSSSNSSVEATIDRKIIDEEIKKTQEVIRLRPDYAGAWVRLSVLYEQIGEFELATQAKEIANKLDHF